MNFSIFLFLIGILGFVLNRKNIILMLISIEIMLLSVNHHQNHVHINPTNNELVNVKKITINSLLNESINNELVNTRKKITINELLNPVK